MSVENCVSIGECIVYVYEMRCVSIDRSKNFGSKLFCIVLMEALDFCSLLCCILDLLLSLDREFLSDVPL